MRLRRLEFSAGKGPNWRWADSTMPQVGMLRRQGEISGTAPELEAALIKKINKKIHDGNTQKQVGMLRRQGETSGTASQLEEALFIIF